MREPRPGLPWSGRRDLRRAEYGSWMSSRAWLHHREGWRDRWAASHGAEPVCQICGGPWDLRHSDLHHRSYARLGHELDSDVVPLCRPCHRRLHRVLESSPVWLWLGRAQATDVIVARLRSRRKGGHG
jgi:5-methylcytosine-specific restriction endonuclease McrA